MQIAESATRNQYPLSPKKIVKKTLGSMIGLLISLIILVAVFWSLLASISQNIGQAIGYAALALVVLTAIVGLSEYFYQRWYYAVYFYDLTPDFIQIRKGPITPREITVPYERIQDVYVDQDIFDRLFGLYDVHISSATISSGMEAHIDGVEKTAADGLRALLLQTVQQKLGRNAPPTSPIATPANNITA